MASGNDDATDRDRPDDERDGGGSLADRLGGMRATLDEATGSVSETVRRTGEALGDSTEGVRTDAANGAETVIARAREQVEETRRSVEGARNDDREGDLPAVRLPVDRLPVDRLLTGRLPVDRLPAGRLPVEAARERFDRTRRSVRRAGGDAGVRAVERARPVRRTAAETGLRARNGIARGLDEVAYTVRNADTREVALWGIGTSLAVSNPAVAAAYPTYAILSAALAAGMGVGAYVSSHEDTPLDDVDPLTLGRTARQRSRAGRRLGSTGAAIGALSAVGSQVADGADSTEYAHWIADADAEAILEGATRAAEYGEGDFWAPLFGGGLGLLYGYARDDSSAATDDGGIRRLLDADLREEFDERTETE